MNVERSDSPSEIGAAGKQHAAKPRGREDVIDAIIDATASLWEESGTAELSLRTIAARAGVNYGLVHRHFGTKAEVMRATMQRQFAGAYELIATAPTLIQAIDLFLSVSSGALARRLAWAVLQGAAAELRLSEDPFLERLCELAAQGSGGQFTAGSREARVLVGSVVTVMFGWRLYEPYVVNGLGLDRLTRPELNASIRSVLATMTGPPPKAARGG